MSEFTSFFGGADMNYPLVDMTYLKWDTRVAASGTGGTYLKTKDGDIYYKMSLYSGGFVIGHESLNEVIISRFLNILGILHVDYKLHNALVKVDGNIFQAQIASSKEFKLPGEHHIALEYLDKLNREEPETRARYFDSYYVDQMLLVDYLIINRDRHGANIELLYSCQNDGTKIYRFAPLFDNGLSLVAPLQNDLESIALFNPLKDVQTNNYIGSRSLEQNLLLINEPVQLRDFTPQEFEGIFEGINNFLTETHISKIKEILIRRLDYVKSQGFSI